LFSINGFWVFKRKASRKFDGLILSFFSPGEPSFFFHFPRISTLNCNLKLQIWSCGPLSGASLAWLNTTISQTQCLICLTSFIFPLFMLNLLLGPVCSVVQISLMGYIFRSFCTRWMLRWRWMVEKCISLEGKHWTLGGETWAFWWCLDVLDWWWTWLLWVSSSRYLDLSCRCRIMLTVACAVLWNWTC
jgi:hypothetical protein